MGCQSTWLDRATVPFRHVSPLIKGCLGDRFSTWKEGRFVAGVPDRVADQVVPFQATRVHLRKHKDVGVGSRKTEWPLSLTVSTCAQMVPTEALKIFAS